MAYRIRLQPSGKTFEAEPQETVLEAALRAGISVPYNCTTGTCGECKARLLSGELGGEEFHDYVFTEAEKLQNSILLCSAHPAGDLEIEVAELEVAADIPHQSVNGRVSAIRELGPNCRELNLRTPRNRTLRFLAGQYVRLKGAEGAETETAVASCPCNGRDLQFHIQRAADDAFAAQVFDGLRVGDTLEVEGPYGTFTLDDESPRPLVLVAEGTRFAAMRSLMEHAANLEVEQPLRLYWVADSVCGHYLTNYCRAMADALDNVEFIPLPAGGDCESAASGITASLPADEPFDLYLAAGGGLIDCLCTAMKGRGTVPARTAIYPWGWGGGRQCGR